MRGVFPSSAGFHTRPVLTVECIRVSLMMSAARAADELSTDSVTRGSRIRYSAHAWFGFDAVHRIVWSWSLPSMTWSSDCGRGWVVPESIRWGFLLFYSSREGDGLHGIDLLVTDGARALLRPQRVRKDYHHAAGQRVRPAVLSQGALGTGKGGWECHTLSAHVPDSREGRIRLPESQDPVLQCEHRHRDGLRHREPGPLRRGTGWAG